MMRIRQIKGAVKLPRRQLETLRGLGLRNIGDEVQVKDTPSILGMVQRISHLVCCCKLSQDQVDS